MRPSDLPMAGGGRIPEPAAVVSPRVYARSTRPIGAFLGVCGPWHHLRLPADLPRRQMREEPSLDPVRARVLRPRPVDHRRRAPAEGDDPRRCALRAAGPLGLGAEEPPPALPRGLVRPGRWTAMERAGPAGP